MRMANMGLVVVALMLSACASPLEPLDVAESAPATTSRLVESWPPAEPTPSDCWEGVLTRGRKLIVVICEPSDPQASPGFTEGVPTPVWDIDHAVGCDALELEAGVWRKNPQSDLWSTRELRAFSAYVTYAEGLAIELGCEWVSS